MTPEKDEVRETPRTDARWKEEWEFHRKSGGRASPAHGMCDFARELEREVQALGERVQVMERERHGRNAIDPVTRLHNLCDTLAEHRRESPYDQASWDLVEQENKELRERAQRAEASLKAAQQDAERWQKVIRLVQYYSVAPCWLIQTPLPPHASYSCAAEEFTAGIDAAMKGSP